MRGSSWFCLIYVPDQRPPTKPTIRQVADQNHSILLQKNGLGREAEMWLSSIWHQVDPCSDRNRWGAWRWPVFERSTYGHGSWDWSTGFALQLRGRQIYANHYSSHSCYYLRAPCFLFRYTECTWKLANIESCLQRPESSFWSLSRNRNASVQT